MCVQQAGHVTQSSRQSRTTAVGGVDDAGAEAQYITAI